MNAVDAISTGLDTHWLAVRGAGAMVASSLIAVVFLLSGASKLREPGPATASMRAFGFQLASTVWTQILGCLEIGVAVLAISVPNAGNLLAIPLLVVFSFVMTRSLLRGEAVSCGCFGETSQRITWHDLARNLVLILAAVVALFWSPIDVSYSSRAFAAIAAIGLVGSFITMARVRQLGMLHRSALTILKAQTS